MKGFYCCIFNYLIFFKKAFLRFNLHYILQLFIYLFIYLQIKCYKTQKYIVHIENAENRWQKVLKDFEKI